jgi:hypothetical protein
MEQHILSNLTSTTIVFINFDFKMFHGGVDTFSFVIDFI